MTKSSIKYFFYIVFFALVVLLILLTAGAMFFTDDKADMVANRIHKYTETMEIHGNWLGMKLVSFDSHKARRLGVPSSLHGVVVVGIQERNGWRARQAGVQEDDIITGVNGKKIRDMADMFDASRKLDVASPVALEVLRWGQPLTLVLPAAAPPFEGTPQVGQGNRPATRISRGENQGAAQPGANQSPQFYCPQHNGVWPQSAVHPKYRCPIGNCPLIRVPKKENPGAIQAGALAPKNQVPQFYCPQHNGVWPQSAVHPHYRCPVGNCPLNRVR